MLKDWDLPLSPVVLTWHEEPDVMPNEKSIYALRVQKSTPLAGVEPATFPPSRQANTLHLSYRGHGTRTQIFRST